MFLGRKELLVPKFLIRRSRHLPESLLKSLKVDIVIKCLFRNYLKNYMCWDTYETVTIVVPSYRDPVCGQHLPRGRKTLDWLVQSIIWSSEVQGHAELYKCNWVWLHNQKSATIVVKSIHHFGSLIKIIFSLLWYIQIFHTFLTRTTQLIAPSFPFCTAGYKQLHFLVYYFLNRESHWVGFIGFFFLKTFAT